ncbi:MAG: SAM-dependent methyltransferase, partial [Candidatus Micrarchaeota archaeon]|nr:SAM-dependent methyltransferase [Candidatus Micrarchaeota archaeon]
MRSKEKKYQRHAPIKPKPKSISLPPAKTKKIAPAGPVRPLSEWMGEKNAAYYKSPTTSIESDFSTYAQSPNGLLTTANAMAFHSFARAHPRQTYDILEAGVGAGMFALGFLQEIARQDEAHQTKILPRVRYTLADFSEPLLAAATQNIIQALPTAQVQAVRLDASKSNSITAALGAFRYDVIRANELFDDLPAEAFCCVNEKIRAVHFDSKAQPQLISSEVSHLELWEEALLRALPSGYFIPLNRQAVGAVLELAQHLRPTGWMDIFDYGFYFKGDFGLFSSIW